MSDKFSNDLYSTEELQDPKGDFSDLFEARPTVRVLVYTDSSRENFDGGTFGFKTMLRLIAENNPFYADIHLENVNRHEGAVSGSRKLTNDYLDLYKYDEIWFFCRGQINIPEDARPVTDLSWMDGNFPDSELDDDEVKLLRDYMSWGGVLIAGDHANPDPLSEQGATDAPETFLNLGRAVGHRIPRAGKLRRWQGPPTIHTDNYDTVAPVPPVDTDVWFALPEWDSIPQKIRLTTYPRGVLSPTHPHPIFCGRNGPIEILPDHMHEGHITIPTEFQEEEWPKANEFQPRPEVIARGTNHVTGESIDLVAAYDGAVAGVGRIVADSTWHHYQNGNLMGFVNEPATGHARTLGNYYVNLAVWLAPAGKREQLQKRFFWKLATHPYMVEVGIQSPYAVGRAALDVLGNEVSVCDIYQMFTVNQASRIMFNELPPMELCLGAILNAYHEQLFIPGGKFFQTPQQLIRSALGKAFDDNIAATTARVELLKRYQKEIQFY